jgi:hypothetical protein
VRNENDARVQAVPPVGFQCGIAALDYEKKVNEVEEFRFRTAKE